MKKKNSYVKKIQNGLTPQQRLYQIVEDGMCIGCGICQSLAGPDNVRMNLVENGAERPVVIGRIEPEVINKIIAVCPGTHIEGLPERLVDEASRYDEVWGQWRRISLAWAQQSEVRYIGSTGGLLTALGLYLVESGEVDFLLHATASNENPTFGERLISRNRADVLRGAGSRYGPTATLIDMLEILDQCEKLNESFALIGTPCDITAMRNLAEIDPRVDEYCRYQLAMVCGGFMKPSGMKQFLGDLGIRMDQVSDLRYRGYGCPGPTRIETLDGNVTEKNYLDFWGEDESVWQLPFRCKVCADGIGDAADIAVSDTWDGGSPTWEGQIDDPGTNAAIVRSAAGEHLLDRAKAAGYVCVGDTLTPRDMDRLQPHQVTKKHSVWARFVGMRSAGKVVPDVRGLRLKPLARRNTLKENLSQARGSRRRSMDGSNSEKTPIPLEPNAESPKR
ncbi:MAG: Coenzyme F420 hydrogenase/dehydrogenase, beta subunit C-terminal domain [bacterium]